MLGKRFTRSLGTAVLLAASGSAWAQVPPTASPPAASSPGEQSPAPASSAGLEEVVVTAEKRAEDIEKTPLAVTAVGGDSLKDQSITRTTDINGLIPAVELGTGFTGTGALVAIRGITTNDIFDNADQSIAFSEDSVALPHPGNALSLLYDINHIEALRGPQGTLYGRNATGGAINIVTNKPNLDNYEAAGSVETGNYGELKTDVMLNAPLSDQLAVRGAMEYAAHNPYFKDGQENQDDISGRLHVLWRPSDDFDLRVSGDYTHIGGDGPGFWVNPPGSGLSGLGISSSADPFDGFPTCPAVGGIASKCAGSSYLDNKTVDVSAELNWRTPYGTITYLPAYSVYLQHNSIWGYTGLFDYFTPSSAERVLTNELRISNPDESVIKWVAGLFYYRDMLNNLQTVANAPGPGPFGTTDDPDDRTDSKAVFGQTTIPVPFVDNLRFTAGARYTEDRKSADILTWEQLGTSVGSTIVSPINSLPQYNKNYNFSFKLGLDYDLTPNSLLYFTYSTGYKSGGYFDAYNGPGATETDTFPAEKIKSWEIGSKNRLFNNRLELNVDAYYYDYTNFQIQDLGLVQTAPSYPFGPFGPSVVPFVNTGIGFPVYPANEIFYGGEIETKTLITENDELDVNLALEHTDQTSFTFYQLFAAPTSYAHYTPVKAPNVTFTVGLQHIFEFADNSNLILHGQTHFESPQWEFFTHNPGAHQPAYTQTQADITYNSSDNNWYISVFGRNLENNAVRDSVYAAGLNILGGIFPPPSGFPFNEASVQPPRLYGVRLGVHFTIPRAPTPAVALPVPPPEPAAAPAPAVQPEAQREFQVFFDFDKSNITDAASHVIQAAADVVRAGGIAHITVTGHTDTVGTARYNQGLSERRAASVKSQLTTDGVDGGEISTVGVGKSGLLVPTKDGVREPQNRRAVIDLQ